MQLLVRSDVQLVPLGGATSGEKPKKLDSWVRSVMAKQCHHLDCVRTNQPRSRGCEACLKLGDIDQLAMELLS
jgi:hypothetical protein